MLQIQRLKICQNYIFCLKSKENKVFWLQNGFCKTGHKLQKGQKTRRNRRAFCREKVYEEMQDVNASLCVITFVTVLYNGVSKKCVTICQQYLSLPIRFCQKRIIDKNFFIYCANFQKCTLTIAFFVYCDILKAQIQNNNCV